MAASIPFNARSTADDVLRGVDLAGKTFAVTGCNSGIGFETVRALAAHGANVLALARSLASARDACSRIPGAVTPIECDLGSLASIRAAVQAIHGLGRPLDALIANAGIVGSKHLELRHGVEIQFFVNHIGHFFLVNSLTDLLPDRTGRIVIVSSSASSEFAPKEGIMFDNLDGRHFYKAFTFYGQSKLANLLFAKELSRRLARRGIAVNALHPGAVGKTGLLRSMGFPINVVMLVAGRFMKSAPQGAATQVLLATSPLVQGITGEYWSDCQIAKPNLLADDEGMAVRLWKVSADLIENALAPA